MSSSALDWRGERIDLKLPLAPVSPGSADEAQILTPEALQFVADLARKFESTRKAVSGILTADGRRWWS